VRRLLRKRLAAWVRRRQGLDPLPLTLHRRRIYILPTPAGLGFGSMLFFMLIAGLNYANSLALFLTFLLAGFALVTMHQCHRNLVGTTLLGVSAPPTFAPQTGILNVTLDNSAGFMRYRIEAAVLDELPAVADVSAHGQARIGIAVPAPTRGVVRIERLQLSSSHPFGLFRAWTWVHMPMEMIVYPRPYGRLPMPAESGQKAGTRSRNISGADEWLGLRAFRDGDSPRQVAWKAYARGAPLLVKEYSALGSELRLFDFAQLARLEMEARLEQLARWVVDAEAQGERYGLVMPADRIEPEHGPQHRHRCLSALALHGHESPRYGKSDDTVAPHP
jgi:uncharacterized protein (DUF58 family)